MLCLVSLLHIKPDVGGTSQYHDSNYLETCSAATCVKLSMLPPVNLTELNNTKIKSLIRLLYIISATQFSFVRRLSFPRLIHCTSTQVHSHTKIFKTTMPDWDEAATLSTCLTLQDISKASQFHNLNSPNSEKLTPILRSIENEKAKGYSKLCLPLTTEKWKERWSQMCLLPTESSEQDKESAARAAEVWRLNPVFTRDEVTITRLGGYRTEKKTILSYHPQMKPKELSSWLPIG